MEVGTLYVLFLSDRPLTFTFYHSLSFFLSSFQKIGVDFALKVIQWSPDTVVRLQLWDIAGQERFGNMTRVRFTRMSRIVLDHRGGDEAMSS